MFFRQILGRCPALAPTLAALTLLATAGCGQRGSLYLPTDPAAADRATLPQLMNPNRIARPAQAASAPAAGAARAPRPPGLDDEPMFGPSTGQANPVRTP